MNEKGEKEGRKRTGKGERGRVSQLTFLATSLRFVSSNSITRTKIKWNLHQHLDTMFLATWHSIRLRNWSAADRKVNAG